MRDPEVLNHIAWAVVNPRQKLPDRDLELARLAVEQAAASAHDEDPEILRTRARVAFLSGDRAAAIRYQLRAIELAPEVRKKEYDTTLAEYRATEEH
ncbi:MAG TPA: hypothetical protein VHR45_18340 [Thermoanaerobaculia bacterium]|nr:hypothetical protein [Thermoanaerobaculia bacterium]